MIWEKVINMGSPLCEVEIEGTKNLFRELLRSPAFKDYIQGKVGAQAVAVHCCGHSCLVPSVFEAMVKINLLSWNTGPL